MRVLLLNARSSSLKCTLLESDGEAVVGRASADWAGPVTRYEFVRPGASRTSEEVGWRGHADAVVVAAREDLSMLALVMKVVET